jgi:glycosyltransferase involved in cell wall biosynthesis
MTQDRLSETRECLELVLPWITKAIIVDGGSIDDSIYYFRNWSLVEPKIEFHIYPWNDQFSEQRNNYLRHVPDGAWVLVSDPDEIFMDETLQKLQAAIQRAEEKGKDMIGFQCRSVTLKGPERVWENLDNYWKRLLFKKYPGTKYAGQPHEHLENHPLQIMDTNLIYEHRKQENVIWVRGCLLPEQRIITNDGYRLIEEVKIGDQVLDMDGNLQKVIEVTKREVDEEIVHIKRIGSPDVFITKEHPIWVANSLPCKFDAKAIRYRPFLQGSHEKKKVTCCNDPNFFYRNFGWLNAGDLNFRHIFHYPKLNKSISKELPPLNIFDKCCNQYDPKKVLIKLTPDIFRLFGYYLSEGDLDFTNRVIEFSFSIYERETLVEDLGKIISHSFNRAVTIMEKEGNCCKVKFNCKDLVEWIDNVFGHLAWGKKIPLSYISTFTEEEKKELLKGLFLGDGTKSDNTISITLASPDLIMSIWILLIELGFRPFIYEIPLETLNNSNSGFQHKHTMFRVSISAIEKEKFEHEILLSGNTCFTLKGRQKVRPSRMKKEEAGKSLSIWKGENSIQSCSTQINLERYKGFVYNIEVEGSHSYCLPYMAIHNCRNYFCGGAGPNLGTSNPHWIKLKDICRRLGILDWHEFQKSLIAGRIHPEIKEEFIKYIDLTEIFPGQTDGLSEMRECYKTYFRIWHPEEEPPELRSRIIP